MTGCYGACPSDDIQSPDSHTLPWGEGGKNADVIPTSKDLHIWLRSQNTIKKKLEIFKVRVWCVEQRDLDWMNSSPFVENGGQCGFLDHRKGFGSRAEIRAWHVKGQMTALMVVTHEAQRQAWLEQRMRSCALTLAGPQLPLFPNFGHSHAIFTIFPIFIPSVPLLSFLHQLLHKYTVNDTLYNCYQKRPSISSPDIYEIHNN